MVPLQRGATPRDNRFITGAKDETSPDVAVPKAFRQLEEKHSAREIARQAGWPIDTIKHTWGMCIAFMFLALSVNASDITRGQSFSDGQRITAAQLQALVDSATINPAFVTDKTEQQLVATGDYFLLYSAAGASLRKISGNNLLLNNTNSVGALTANDQMTTNNQFAFLDPVNGSMRKVTWLNLISASNNIAFYPAWTNSIDALTFPVYDLRSNYTATYANIKTNFATNWPAILWIGPTNTAPTPYTNSPIAVHTAPVDADRFWVYDSANNVNKAMTLLTLKKAVTNCSIIGDARDLVMQATNATIQLLQCTDMVLKATNGASYATGAFTLTNNLALANPTNGVDTGSAGVSSNWYYIHVMSDGTNVATIASLSSNNPALPAPFIYRAMAGPAFYDSASHYYTNYQTGREVTLYTSNILSAAVTASYQWLTAASASAGTLLSNAIPPVATQVYGVLGAPGTTLGPITSIAADNSGLGEVIAAFPTAGSAINSFGAATPFRLTLKTNQTFCIKAFDTQARNRINVTGYRF